MPYIVQADRDGIDEYVKPLVLELAGEPGNLNYAISTLCRDYLAVEEHQHGRVRYADLNTVIGVLESAKLELYRRMLSPYEDKKIAENGDVY